MGEIAAPLGGLNALDELDRQTVQQLAEGPLRIVWGVIALLHRLAPPDQVAVETAEAPTAQVSAEGPWDGSEPAIRGEIFARIVAGWRAGGLPVPEQIIMYGFRSLMVHCDDGDTAAVEQWAAYLRLPVPRVVGCVHDADTPTPWRVYEASGDLLGWSAKARCRVSVPPQHDVSAAAEALPVGAGAR